MSWFDEQVRNRKLNDNEVYNQTFIKIEDAIKGRNIVEDEKLIADLKAKGYMSRNIILQKGWYKDSFGTILAYRKDNKEPTRLTPNKIKGYSFYDTKTKKNVLVNSKNENIFESEAFCFYRPLPNKVLNVYDLIRFAFESLSKYDFIIPIVVTLIYTFATLTLPTINYYILSSLSDSINITPLVSMMICLIVVSLSTTIINSTKELLVARMSTKLNASFSSAIMMRVLQLPTSFFKKYTSGEIASRINLSQELCTNIFKVVFSTFFATVCSILYIVALFDFHPDLIDIIIFIEVLLLIVIIAIIYIQSKSNDYQMDIGAKESGFSFIVINNVRRIRLSGSEKRIFSKWGDIYAKQAEPLYNPSFIVKTSGILVTIIVLLGNLILYYAEAKQGLSAPIYFGIDVLYSLSVGTFVSIANMAPVYSRIYPGLKMLEPILKTMPETKDNSRIIEDIKGKIEFNNVCFKYDDSSTNLFEGLNLSIKPNEYVAIVGKSGCGKSTIIRLLLGFEKAQRGSVFIDGLDINSINVRSLRKKIGTVAQDGNLINGTIATNITFNRPKATLDEINEVIKLTGLDKDIEKLPMGIQTYVTEGNGNMSSGMKQKILIARTIINKPKILVLDEATSNLDNDNQEQIAKAIDSLHCTKIAIAHRLSTVKNADHILVLDSGKIIEEGKFEDLMQNDGFFADLVKKQLID